MSTRCQTQVIERHKEVEANWKEEKITLYHHCDGSPSNMLKLFLKAYRYGVDPYPNSWNKELIESSWQAHRAGYAAAFLCHIEPRGFQPEESHELHGDIAFYYKIFVSKGEWEIEIFVIDIQSRTHDDLWLVYDRTKISDFINNDGEVKKEILEEIEKSRKNSYGK